MTMENNDIMIRVENASVRFNMASEKIDSLKEYAVKLVRRELMFKEFFALRNIDLTVRRGESWAFVGRNGAGKSTLLMLISRILVPYEGKVTVNGSIAPMIELGAGFDPNLTAEENIFINGCIMGHSKKFMQEHFDEIVEFAQLQDFLKMPIKNYSSGMRARLGFAVATMVKPDILIVDEVLSVGDMKFREKCLQRMNDIAVSGKTILCVSHVMSIVRGLCNRAIVLEHGKMIYNGEVEHAIKLYNGINEVARVTSRDLYDLPRPRYLNEKMRMLHVDVLENNNRIYKWDEPIRFLLHVEAKADAEDVSLRAVFRCDNGTPASCAFLPLHADFKAGEIKDIYVSIDRHNLAPGDYKVGLDLTQENTYDIYNNVDSITPEAFFITVKNIGAADYEVEDNSARLWYGSWGTSRIMDVTGEVRD